MNNQPAYVEVFDDPPDDWHQLNVAIDVVASLAEHASRIANKGASELSMSEAFDATFAYMVDYLHHLTIDKDAPRTALAKAATASTGFSCEGPG
jgi:hypothetical protein